jgi:hypothetical protein
MGSILDKAYEDEDERLEKIKKDKAVERAKRWNPGSNGLEYSHVNIFKIDNKAWIGDFLITFFQSNHEIKPIIIGNSPEDVLKKIEVFLCIEIKSNEYTVFQKRKI